MKSELRKDYLEDKYVIIAPARGKRPHELVAAAGSRQQAAGSKQQAARWACHLCPGQIDRERPLLTVGGRKKWSVKVVANKFPAVSTASSGAYGRQEIVIETPDHRLGLENLPATQIAQVLGAYTVRTEQIMKDPRIQYILIFKNSGERAGATLSHAHSQIFATALVPPHLKDKAERAQAYRARTGRCAYCDIIARERKGARLIFENRDLVVFTPYASVWSYEVWLLPKRHIDNITKLSAPEQRAWAAALKRLLGRVRRLGLPYNYYFHQVVRNQDEHLYLKLIPRASVLGPVELGTGLAINSVPPEEAARFYRGR